VPDKLTAIMCTSCLLICIGLLMLFLNPNISLALIPIGIVGFAYCTWRDIKDDLDFPRQLEEAYLGKCNEGDEQ